MKITSKSIKYFIFILAFSLFVTYFNLKLKKSLSLENTHFGSEDFMYSVGIDLGVFYIGKLIYYLIDFKGLIVV